MHGLWNQTNMGFTLDLPLAVCMTQGKLLEFLSSSVNWGYKYNPPHKVVVRIN